MRLRQFISLTGALLSLALFSGCINPGYNDNPSQQITTPRAGCPAATEFFGVYFSLRINPLADSQQARVRKELFRSYCNEIPMPGKVFFTADLIGNDLLTRNIGISVVEQAFAGYGARLEDRFRDVRTIADFKPAKYSKGVIEIQFELENNGYYAVHLRRDGDTEGTGYDVLTIPLHVGVESEFKLLTWRMFSMLAIGVGCLLLLRFAARRFSRR